MSEKKEQIDLDIRKVLEQLGVDGKKSEVFISTTLNKTPKK